MNLGRLDQLDRKKMDAAVHAPVAYGTNPKIPRAKDIEHTSAGDYGHMLVMAELWASPVKSTKRGAQGTEFTVSLCSYLVGAWHHIYSKWLMLLKVKRNFAPCSCAYQTVHERQPSPFLAICVL